MHKLCYVSDGSVSPGTYGTMPVTLARTGCVTIGLAGIHQDHAGLGLVSAFKPSEDCAIDVPAIRRRLADAYEPVYNDLSALSHNPPSVMASLGHTSAGMRGRPCLCPHYCPDVEWSTAQMGLGPMSD